MREKKSGKGALIGVILLLAVVLVAATAVLVLRVGDFNGRNIIAPSSLEEGFAAAETTEDGVDEKTLSTEAKYETTDPDEVNAEDENDEKAPDATGGYKKMIMREYNSRGELNYSKEYEYDREGNSVRETIFDADGTVLSVTCPMYDRNGESVFSVGQMTARHDEDGTVIMYEERYNYYVRRGDAVMKSYFFYEDELQYSWAYQPTANDNENGESKAIYYNGSEAKGGYIISERDGDTTKVTNYDRDGNVQYITETIKDSFGNTELVLSYDANGELTSELVYEYTYNDEGKKVKERQTNSASSSENWFTYEYEYDDENRMILETSYREGSSAFITKKTYEYVEW